MTDLDAEKYRSFVFPESVFTAVTAYQNQLVSSNSNTYTHRTCAYIVCILLPTRGRIGVNIILYMYVVASALTYSYTRKIYTHG